MLSICLNFLLSASLYETAVGLKTFLKSYKFDKKGHPERESNNHLQKIVSTMKPTCAISLPIIYESRVVCFH